MNDRTTGRLITLTTAMVFVAVACSPKPAVTVEPTPAVAAPKSEIMSALASGPLSAGSLLSHAYALADDSLNGRGAGTADELAAAHYIRRQFVSYGLQPSIDDYLQPFSFVSHLSLGTGNSLTASGNYAESVAMETDFRPIGFSSNGSATGDLVFAGYGISSDDPAYDDYADIDVEGKVVLVLRFSSDGTNPHGTFESHTPLRKKALVAREKGAVALLVTSGPEEDGDDYLTKLSYDKAGDAGIPVVSVSRRAVDRIIASTDFSIKSLQAELNRSRMPLSIPISGMTISLNIDITPVRAESRNVLATLPGVGSLKDEWIVLGAHYDHLGMGGDGSGSLAPNELAIHNGADDNASGTSVMLGLAEKLSKISNVQTVETPDMVTPRRSVMFQAYGAEERGLLGSSYVTKNSPVPMDKIVAMLNMDMVGRLASGKLVVGGAGTSPLWKKLVPSVNDDKLSITYDEGGFGASDHQSYYLADKPVLFFFTGSHRQYHRPTDDVGYLDAQGMSQVAGLVDRIVSKLMTRDVPPAFSKPKASKMPTRGGFAVVLGTVPDYTYEGAGLRLSGTRAGSPADIAGLMAGDIMIGFGETEVKSIYDYMYALQAAKAGVTLRVTILRGEETIEVDVTPERANN